MASRTRLSIVIPAFNEFSRIEQSLHKIHEFFRHKPFEIEMIVVDDGSTDRTADVAKRFGSRLLQNDGNRGKGYSVRRGALFATGDYVLFTDADLSAPIDQLETLLQVATEERADIVIGSRGIDRSYIKEHQSPLREFAGIIYNRMARIVLGLDFHDTQCGFKLFHRENTKCIFEKQVIDGFGFDPELLFLAKRRGLRVREVPVRWSHSDGTKVRMVRDSLRMFFNLVQIRWNCIVGRYS